MFAVLQCELCAVLYKLQCWMSLSFGTIFCEVFEFKLNIRRRDAELMDMSSAFADLSSLQDSDENTSELDRYRSMILIQEKRERVMK